MVKRKCELAIDKEKSGSHSIENPSFQHMYHFISVYLCLQRLAQKAIGNWNFSASLRMVLLLLCWTRKVPRYQERCHGPSQFFWRPCFSLLWDRFCDFQGKKLSLAEGLPAHCWQKIAYILLLQKLHETVSFHLRKGWMTMNYRAKTLQNGPGKKAVDAEAWRDRCFTKWPWAF